MRDKLLKIGKSNDPDFDVSIDKINFEDIQVNINLDDKFRRVDDKSGKPY